MKTLKNTPELMTVICNIQSMRQIINSSYSISQAFKDFKNLEKLNDQELHKLQDELIPLYNKAIKTINQ